jgi:hypothetical protein
MQGFGGNSRIYGLEPWNIRLEASLLHVVSPSPSPPVKGGGLKTLSPGGRGQGEGESDPR